MLMQREKQQQHRRTNNSAQKRQKGKQESSKRLAQDMRFRIAMPTSCLLALQGSSTLLHGLGLLPSAGRHASCLSLFSFT